jgi:hypothetical protein
MALPARRATHHLSTALSCCAAAVVAAGAALLSLSGMARATPINFVLSDVTANFPPTISFSGSFTFDSTTLAETNIDVTASPTNASNPVIVASYTAEGALCAGFTAPNSVCFTDTADDAAILFGDGPDFDDTTTSVPIAAIAALNPEADNFIEIFPAQMNTGAADVAAVPEPPSLVLFVTALGLSLFFGRWTDRRPSA